jgi:photosystem II stability/assembly factor-like uncharacterized protein
MKFTGICPSLIFLPLTIFILLLIPIAYAQSNAWVKLGLNDYIVSLAVDKNNRLYAGGNGMYRSTDSGASWTKISNGLPNNFVHALEINSSDHLFAGLSYAGVHRSIDNGDQWTSINPSLVNVVDFAFDATGNIYAVAVVDGIFRSTDSGSSWTDVNNGLNGNLFSSIAINDKGHIFVATTTSVPRLMELSLSAPMGRECIARETTVKPGCKSIEDFL